MNQTKILTATVSNEIHLLNRKGVPKRYAFSVSAHSDSYYSGQVNTDSTLLFLLRPSAVLIRSNRLTLSIANSFKTTCGNAVLLDEVVLVLHWHDAQKVSCYKRQSQYCQCTLR